MSNSLNAASSPTPLHDLANQILDELRAISDRILVLRSGAIAATFPPDTPVATLGEAMLA